MQITNLLVFYKLGEHLNHFGDLIRKNTPMVKLYMMSANPKAYLEIFLDQTKLSFESDLKATRASAKALLATILQSLGDIPRNSQCKLPESEAKAILDGIDALEMAFERENRNLIVFTITRIGIYDTGDLILYPEHKFPEKLRPLLPEQMLYDLRQAGQCLAFDVPTACAFHIFRGTEAVMLAYYELLAKHPWTLRKKDWNIYIEQLAKEGAPKQITNRLEEIRVLDRNPYIHPDLNVPLEDAPLLFELCTGVVHFMAQEMNKLI